MQTPQAHRTKACCRSGVFPELGHTAPSSPRRAAAGAGAAVGPGCERDPDARTPVAETGAASALVEHLGVPALAKGRERNTALRLHAAVPAGKHFSPPAEVSVVLEITSGSLRSEFASSRFLSHPRLV